MPRSYCFLDAKPPRRSGIATQTDRDLLLKAVPTVGLIARRRSPPCHPRCARPCGCCPDRIGPWTHHHGIPRTGLVFDVRKATPILVATSRSPKPTGDHRG